MKPLDRGDAVNIARNVLDVDSRIGGLTDKGVKTLAEAVLAMDAELSRLYACGDGGITQALVAMARENAIEECADLADQKLDHYSGTECTYRGDVAEAIRQLKSPLCERDKSA